MSDVKHTPGPWAFEASRDGYGYSVLWNPETRQEVLVTSGYNDGDSPITWMGEELSDTDKALIENAPDLLAALKEMLTLHLAHHNNPTHVIARATIAAAEGRTP